MGRKPIDRDNDPAFYDLVEKIDFILNDLEDTEDCCRLDLINNLLPGLKPLPEVSAKNEKRNNRMTKRSGLNF
jgi:hypothetical protein